MVELESRQRPKSPEPLLPNQGHPPADECEKPVADWWSYTPETLHALDG